MQLKQWLGFRALAQQQADEERERAQAKKAKTSKAGKAGARAAALREEEEGGSGDGDEDGADPYERDPALGDLLQFLLSLPYVDEAWGIQDLILVSASASSQPAAVDLGYLTLSYFEFFAPTESRAGRRRR
jgi:hypothetical protein